MAEITARHQLRRYRLLAGTGRVGRAEAMLLGELYAIRTHAGADDGPPPQGDPLRRLLADLGGMTGLLQQLVHGVRERLWPHDLCALRTLRYALRTLPERDRANYLEEQAARLYTGLAGELTAQLVHWAMHFDLTAMRNPRG